jgi:hypothetical protein
VIVQRGSAGFDDGGHPDRAHRDGGGGNREFMAAVRVGVAGQEQGAQSVMARTSSSNGGDVVVG